MSDAGVMGEITSYSMRCVIPFWRDYESAPIDSPNRDAGPVAPIGEFIYNAWRRLFGGMREHCSIAEALDPASLCISNPIASVPADAN
jgi:hypothetical protein